ncbi:translational regulator orb2-like [Halichondria panicea]|uniref:translational regulator orb2-like n=1 Tax=Halichondria panicea TaxID=6063 RepID=UPI00312B73A1
MLRSVPPGPRSRAPHSASTSGNFNPNCHFYLQAPGASIPPAHRIRSTSLSEASFNPWSPSDSNPPIPATTHASLWAYPASSMWSNNNIQKQRTRSICFEKTCRYLRSMETNDMVEDALFREEGKLQPLTPDTDKDSGTCSPYGILDWADPHKTRRPTTVDCTVPDATCFGCKQQPPTYSLRQFLLAGKFTSLLNCNHIYSRKVFVGGLPPDYLDDQVIKSIFARFGSLSVDWPHKLHTKSCVPPRGYAFLLFKDESSVHKLLFSCSSESNKYFIYIPTNTMTKKKVQIRPWCLPDGICVKEPSHNIDLRKAVFIGGVPRPLKAVELAQIMRDKYGSVMLVAIVCDTDLKYPKGAACVVFSSHASYIAAVSARFMQLNYASMDKKIEIQPYVLEGQMCDECHGVQCNKKPAPFYCASLNCLQYYCEYCWATIHSMPGKQNHRPLQKNLTKLPSAENVN